MDITMVTLRVIHILSGVFWAGTAFFSVGFLQRAVAEAGPEGGRFMKHLTGHRRFQISITLAAWLTILSGIALYGRVSAGFQRAWIMTGTGLVLAVAGLAAILAVFIGWIINGPASARLGRLAGEVQRSGGQPSSSQQVEMQRLQRRISQIAQWIALLLAVTVVGMAIARYV